MTMARDFLSIGVDLWRLLHEMRIDPAEVTLTVTLKNQRDRFALGHHIGEALNHHGAGLSPAQPFFQGEIMAMSYRIELKP